MIPTLYPALRATPKRVRPLSIFAISIVAACASGELSGHQQLRLTAGPQVRALGVDGYDITITHDRPTQLLLLSEKNAILGSADITGDAEEGFHFEVHDWASADLEKGLSALVLDLGPQLRERQSPAVEAVETSAQVAALVDERSSCDYSRVIVGPATYRVSRSQAAYWSVQHLQNRCSNAACLGCCEVMGTDCACGPLGDYSCVCTAKGYACDELECAPGMVPNQQRGTCDCLVQGAIKISATQCECPEGTSRDGFQCVPDDIPDNGGSGSQPGGGGGPGAEPDPGGSGGGCGWWVCHAQGRDCDGRLVHACSQIAAIASCNC